MTKFVYEVNDYSTTGETVSADKHYIQDGILSLYTYDDDGINETFVYAFKSWKTVKRVVNNG